MTVMKRIALAREYRVAEWLQEACLDGIRQKPLDFDELQPSEPSYSESKSEIDRDWEADAKQWKAISREWETLARITQLQMKVATTTPQTDNDYCQECKMFYGVSYRCLCKCRLIALADEAFGGELKSLKQISDHVEHPLPCKLPISYLPVCSLTDLFIV